MFLNYMSILVCVWKNALLKEMYTNLGCILVVHVLPKSRLIIADCWTCSLVLLSTVFLIIVLQDVFCIRALVRSSFDDELLVFIIYSYFNTQLKDF